MPTYKIATREEAYQIGYGTPAPVILVDSKKAVIYPMLEALKCSIKSSGSIHTASEYSTPDASGKYRAIVLQDLETAVPTYTITFEMNGHGEQISPVVSSTIPNPLPIPSDPDYRIGGWFLDSGFSAKAVAGAPITQNTTLYAKWIAKTLVFSINSAMDTSLVPRNSISSIKLNDTTYTGSDLDSHYNSETGSYTFTDFTAETVNYSITNTSESSFKDLEASQTFESLNGNRILLYPKTATLGDINVSANWTRIGGTENENIFDMYTLIYQGQAPSPGETFMTNPNQITQLSWEKHNEDFHIPVNTSTGGFTVNYDTNLGGASVDNNPGETTKITLDTGDNSISSLEELLRTYSFVFIMNNYGYGKPGTSSPTSQFATRCPDMAWTINIAGKIKTIPINLPQGSTGETGDQSANWIAFKTRILGPQEDIAEDLSNVIVEFTRDGYSYFDGTNSAKTYTYLLDDGGYQPGQGRVYVQVELADTTVETRGYLTYPGPDTVDLYSGPEKTEEQHITSAANLISGGYYYAGGKV